MSDSELSDAPTTPAPPDAELEKSLRQEVSKAFRSGGEFSYNSIRTASEALLGLKEGFYKAHDQWKGKSKDVINQQLEIENQTPSTTVVPKQSAAKSKKERAPKRPSKAQDRAPRKKRKQSPVDDESTDPLSSVPSEIGSASSAEESKPKRTPAAKQSQRGKPPRNAVQKDSELEARNEEDNQGDHPEPTAPSPGDSDSDLSVVLDEEPRPKKQKQKQKSKEGPVGKAKTKASKSITDAGGDPDQAEIKRLQGWLVKCGIRKLWGKELKPYETSKAKIKHLKDMLADAGMTGRYSLEKASQIKEARELAADIEAVQEGAERWGTGGESRGENADGHPARRLFRGAKNYDFLSSDGEETD